MQNLKVEVLQMAPENTNSVLISRGGDCVIFDAWGRADDWDKVLTNNNLTLRGIYSTHGHSDHISAAPELAARHHVPWYLSHQDLSLIPWGNALLAHMGLPAIPDNYQKPDDLPAGEYEILPGVCATVIETPGHSAGGVAFHFPEQNLLIIGDTLFQDSVGRYDLPGGDVDALQRSIGAVYDRHLPDSMVVIHGHGADSTIASLKQDNPYFNGSDEGCDDDQGDACSCQCGEGHCHGAHNHDKCCHGHDGNTECCGGLKCGGASH